MESALLRAILDSSPSFHHVLKGPSLVFEYANAAYHRLVGRTSLIGLPAFETMPEAAAGGFPSIILNVMATRIPYHGSQMPVTLERTPGSPPEVRYVDVDYFPIVDEHGACERVAGHGTDVTEHVRARIEAERSERRAHGRMLQALRTAGMVSWEWDPLTDAVTFSEAMPALYRLPQDATLATASDWQQAIHPDDRQRHVEKIREAAATTGSWRLEFRLNVPQEEPVWLEELAYAVTDPDTAGKRVMGLVWEVTDRKRYESELRQADERKTGFLATLAHELRNPLNALSNGLTLLKLAPPEPRVARVRDMMERQLGHLIRLVEDLLEVSRITRGKVELRRKRLPLGTVLAAALDAVLPRMEAKGIRLDLRADDALAIHGDPDRLVQVFTNLLANAEKFTPSGGTVTLVSAVEAQEAVVRVIDTGSGIDAERLESIFEMYAQGPSPQSDSGLGIGLALVRQLVELHGGVVRATSDGPGRGSQFVVRIPLQAPPADPGAGIAR